MHPGTKAPIKVYRVTDPAIDRWLARLPSGEVVRVDPDEPMPEGARFLWGIYAETRDLADVRLVEDAVPETYYVRTLSMSEAREALVKASDVERQFFAFARGLTRVDKLPGDTGERRDWIRADDASDKPKPITEKAIEAAFDVATVCEIGEVICQLSFYKRQTERMFALPRTSLAALQAISRRPAARTSGSSSSASTKPDLAAASASLSSSYDGAVSTDATATASPSTSSTPEAPTTPGPRTDST